MTTIKQCLNQAKHQLENCVDQPLFEAEILLAHVLQQSRGYLHAWPDDVLSNEEEKKIHHLLKRREQREPIAYLTGKKEFWSLDLCVTTDTLIPRPETELIVETVLKKFNNQHQLKVADLGTGSGAIALALAHERPHWQVYATDISERALAVACQNASQLQIKNLAFFQGNWCTALPCSHFDVLVSNPPYLALAEWEEYSQGLLFEPKLALLSGKEGLDAIREICKKSHAFLKPSGLLIIEHGYRQGPAVRLLFAQTGFLQIETLRDGLGLERVTFGLNRNINELDKLKF